MKQANINKLHLVRARVLSCPDKALQSTIITLINSVLLDENGAGDVLYKEPIIVFECQACFTKFTRDDQKPIERQEGRCPSCGHSDLKIVQLTSKSEQDRINAVLEG